jgi:hypothetical protein
MRLCVRAVTSELRIIVVGTTVAEGAQPRIQTLVQAHPGLRHLVGTAEWSAAIAAARRWIKLVKALLPVHPVVDRPEEPAARFWTQLLHGVRPHDNDVIVEHYPSPLPSALGEALDGLYCGDERPMLNSLVVVGTGRLQRRKKFGSPLAGGGPIDFNTRKSVAEVVANRAVRFASPSCFINT